MNDDLTYKLVNALKQHASHPQGMPSSVSIRNLTITVNGDIHIHHAPKQGASKVHRTTSAARRELISEISSNAGRYFPRQRFNSVIRELFGVQDLQSASLAVLKKISAWASDWHKAVIQSHQR